MKNLGKRIETLRVNKGLTQKEVAEKLGIAASTYRDWEYGKQIKGEPYLALSQVLQVSLTELITGNADLPTSKIMQELREIQRIVESIQKNVVLM